ncbi:unnamed protein product [Rotaria socialis]|uniref:Uncharacterized protein n=1 Tax=Rotaria socialis TaxID=392032 RepID=A0A818R2K1_9BILA|nr:unnamed protein product [Rotaria socialis]CAF4758204.1 unnamed protein product [Rotaria socialis]
MTDIYSIKPGTVFAWFMLVLVIRRIVLIVMLIASGIAKSSGAASQPVEVARNGGSGKNAKESDQADLGTLINTAITNDSENDTYFLILYLATGIYSYSVNVDVLRMIVYGAVYLFARIIHSVVLILELQPYRTLAYLIGLMCTLAISIDLVVTMSRSTN